MIGLIIRPEKRMPIHEIHPDSVTALIILIHVTFFIMLLYLTQLSYLCLHLYVDIIAVKYATEIYFVLDNLAKSGLAQASVSRHCQVTQWSPLGGKHIASLGTTMATRMLGLLQKIKS